MYEVLGLLFDFTTCFEMGHDLVSWTVQLNYVYPPKIFPKAYAHASGTNVDRNGESCSEQDRKPEYCFQKIPGCVTDFFWKIVTCSFKK